MNVITRHWELKLVALAFAVALWLFVMTSEKTDLLISAPIQFEDVPPGLVVTGEQPESVDVQVHGLRGSLSRLVPDRLRARVSLAGARPGEVTLRIVPENIAVPPGVTVLRISPSRIRLVLASGLPPGGQSTAPGPRS
jgi:hypothetical protein